MMPPSSTTPPARPPASARFCAPAAAVLRLLQLLVALEQRDLQLALLGAIARPQLAHALPVVLVAHLLGRGRGFALIVERRRQVPPGLAGQGELLVDLRQHLGALQRAGDRQRGLQVGQRLVGPPGLAQHEGEAAVRVGEVAPVFQRLEGGERAREVVQRPDGITPRAGDQAEVGQRLGDGAAVVVGLAELQRLLVVRGGEVELPEPEVVVAEAVQQAGADAHIPGPRRQIQPEPEMLQRVLVAAVALVGQPQAAVGAGEQGGIVQLRGELELLQVAFERARIVGEVPVEPAEQVEKIHLQAEVAELARPGEAVPRAGQAGGIIPAAALQVHHRHQRPRLFQLGAGRSQGLLRGGPHLVTVGQFAVGRGGKRRAGIAHGAGRGGLRREAKTGRQQPHDGQERARHPGHGGQSATSLLRFQPPMARAGSMCTATSPMASGAATSASCTACAMAWPSRTLKAPSTCTWMSTSRLRPLRRTRHFST
jgi:hypothetical protein